MSTAFARLGESLGRMLRGPDRLEMTVGPDGPRGDLGVPRAGDGVWEVTTVQGRPLSSARFVMPAASSAAPSASQPKVTLRTAPFGYRMSITASATPS